MFRWIVILSSIVLLAIMSVNAQELTAEPNPAPTETSIPVVPEADETSELPEVTETPEPPVIVPELVTVTAQDGLTLFGDLYEYNLSFPTIIMIHQLWGDRTDWATIARELVPHRYNVLAVDLRGHGTTGGQINWAQSVADIAVWMDWLRVERMARPDVISTMGSSMGSSIAVNSCANDPFCRTSIAISPGRSYFGISIEQALRETLANRPVLFMYAERDRYPAAEVPFLVEIAAGHLEVAAYPGNEHGMDFLMNDYLTTVPQIINWLNAYSGLGTP